MAIHAHSPVEPASGFPARLVCPRCRVPGEDGLLTVSFLSRVADALGSASSRCPLCGTSYPEVDGIPCVPPDLPAFNNSQGWMLKFDWFGDREKVDAACRLASELEPSGESFRELSTQAMHALAHFPDAAGPLAPELSCNGIVVQTVRNWLERHESPAHARLRCVLEAGCGPGAILQAVAPTFPEGAIGLDIRIGLLRLARRLGEKEEVYVPFGVEGKRFEPVRIAASREPGAIYLLQGDILAPPLEAEAFPAVIAMQLLDTVRDPLFAFGQLDALLAPGGLMVLGTPYSWDSRITEAREWWSGPNATGAETLRSILAGSHRALPHVRYEILEQTDRLAWTIPGHGRMVYRFFLDMVLARKMSVS